MPSGAELLAELPPHCPVCGGLLKPDFVFFGEGIPEEASNLAFDGAKRADCVLVIGTSGEVMPACRIPYEAKRHGAFVIEVNPGESAFAANGISDFLVAENAGTALPKILEAMNV